MKPDDLQNIAQELGLQFDEASSAIYGEREGCQLFLLETGKTNQLRLFFSVRRADLYQPADGEQPFSYDQQTADAELKELTKESSLLSDFQSAGFKISYVIKAAMTLGKTREQVKEAVQQALDFLRMHGFQTVCERTGQDAGVGIYQMADSLYILQEESYAELNAYNDSDRQAHEERSENIVGGLFGAFVGSIIGGAVVLLISQLGYVSVAAGIAMGFCTIKGYELLGRKLSNTGIAISIVFMILMTFVANQLDYALLFIREEMPSASIFESFIAITSYVLNGGELGGYWFNLGLLYLFTGVGAFYAISSAVSRRSQRFVSRKLS